MIRVGLEGSIDELLDQAADGVAVGAQSALFDHHVAFFIKLAHHRVQETLGFEVGPEFEAIRREGVEVVGFIVAGIGVHALAALALDDLAKFVGLDVFLGFVDGVLPCFLELLDLVLIAIDAFIALGNVCCVLGFYLGEGCFFGGIVRSADLVGSLEGHVLEHVREPGLAHGVLHRAGIDVGEE